MNIQILKFIIRLSPTMSKWMTKGQIAIAVYELHKKV